MILKLHDFIADYRKFWNFMRYLNDYYIEESIQKIKKSSEKEKIKAIKKDDLPICILTMDRGTDLAKINRRLLYIIEGVIPLLSGLCQELSLHLYAGAKFPQLDSEKVKVAKNLVTKLMVQFYHCMILYYYFESIFMIKKFALCQSRWKR